MALKVPLTPASPWWSCCTSRAGGRSTPRWWTMRWPQNAISLVGRAGALSPGKTYELMRTLRKHALKYLGQLWMLASDRRHAKDATTHVSELKADWGRMQKRLGKCRVKAGAELRPATPSPAELLCNGA